VLLPPDARRRVDPERRRLPRETLHERGPRLPRRELRPEDAPVDRVEMPTVSRQHLDG
jgi:hypothetical protein